MTFISQKLNLSEKVNPETPTTIVKKESFLHVESKNFYPMTPVRITKFSLLEESPQHSLKRKELSYSLPQNEVSLALHKAKKTKTELFGDLSTLPTTVLKRIFFYAQNLNMRSVSKECRAYQASNDLLAYKIYDNLISTPRPVDYLTYLKSTGFDKYDFKMFQDLSLTVMQGVNALLEGPSSDSDTVEESSDMKLLALKSTLSKMLDDLVLQVVEDVSLINEDSSEDDFNAVIDRIVSSLKTICKTFEEGISSGTHRKSLFIKFCQRLFLKLMNANAFTKQFAFHLLPIFAAEKYAASHDTRYNQYYQVLITVFLSKFSMLSPEHQAFIWSENSTLEYYAAVYESVSDNQQTARANFNRIILRMIQKNVMLFISLHIRNLNHQGAWILQDHFQAIMKQFLRVFNTSLKDQADADGSVAIVNQALFLMQHLAKDQISDFIRIMLKAPSNRFIDFRARVDVIMDSVHFGYHEVKEPVLQKVEESFEMILILFTKNNLVSEELLDHVVWVFEKYDEDVSVLLDFAYKRLEEKSAVFLLAVHKKLSDLNKKPENQDRFDYILYDLEGFLEMKNISTQ